MGTVQLPFLLRLRMQHFHQSQICHQSQIYHAALKKVGGESTLITVEGGGHNAPRAVGESQVRLFLGRHLRGKGEKLADETVPTNR